MDYGEVWREVVLILLIRKKVPSLGKVHLASLSLMTTLILFAPFGMGGGNQGPTIYIAN